MAVDSWLLQSAGRIIAEDGLLNRHEPCRTDLPVCPRRVEQTVRREVYIGNMKAVILAGGRGSRMGEESTRIPKPMIEIGGKPILWHILSQFSKWGINEFVILLGYKGYVIKEYFANFLLHNADCEIDLKNQSIEYLNSSKDWKVKLIDTGRDSLTGTRLRIAQQHFNKDRFLLTYGDGLSDIKIPKLLEFHSSHGKLLTVTAVHPLGRFGSLEINELGAVTSFQEKKISERKINGGYFVCEPEALEYIADGNIMWEAEPLEQLSSSEQLMAYQHDGFWQCMDSPREKEILEAIWKKGNPPWI